MRMLKQLYIMQHEKNGEFEGCLFSKNEKTLEKRIIFKRYTLYLMFCHKKTK